MLPRHVFAEPMDPNRRPYPSTFCVRPRPGTPPPSGALARLHPIASLFRDLVVYHTKPVEADGVSVCMNCGERSDKVKTISTEEAGVGLD